MKTQKQNEPQLSAEMEKLHRFIFTEWDIDANGSCQVLEKYVLNFLATALEEQKKDITTQIEKLRRTPIFEPKETALAVIYNEAIDDVLAILTKKEQ